MNVTLRRSIAAAVLVVPVLSSCGFDQPTDRVYTPAIGVNERAETIDVLNAFVVSGTDGSGTLVAGLANNDVERDDALTQVGGTGLQVALDAPVEIPAGGSVQLLDAAEPAVRGQEIEPGAFVEVTMSFERAGNVTVEVPVVAHRGAYVNVPVP